MSKPIMPSCDTRVPARAQHTHPTAPRRRPAVTGPDAPDPRELDRWSNRLARMLVEEGAGPGSWIVTAGLPSLERAVTRWAIAKVGATATPAVCTDTRGRAHLGVTTKAARPTLSPDITWLVLDDRATLVRYLTGSDAPLTPTERATTARPH
ncbi:hypothetical protein [Nocardia macrotermitis]|uniref:AMP-dependent synthetase/ligase domain-containing protein n=1 Tax=Nocardia macrotermitis TaxID=2585198 RepID=A0A7K0CYN1_9NOCA|nr:hypothetical protein [Nocardia macrotermitis]MQY18585.1 hypothetical protein [Nocardia macrotermitis]